MSFKLSNTVFIAFVVTSLGLVLSLAVYGIYCDGKCQKAGGMFIQGKCIDAKEIKLP